MANFRICRRCGNLAELICDGGVPMSCCGGTEVITWSWMATMLPNSPLEIISAAVAPSREDSTRS